MGTELLIVVDVLPVHVELLGYQVLTVTVAN